MEWNTLPYTNIRKYVSMLSDKQHTWKLSLVYTMLAFIRLVYYLQSYQFIASCVPIYSDEYEQNAPFEERMLQLKHVYDSLRYIYAFLVAGGDCVVWKITLPT